MSKFCTTCGTSLDDNATFCTNCGTPQDAAPQNAAPAGVPGDATPAANAASAIKNTFSGVSFSSVKESLTMDNIKNITKKPNKNTIIGLVVIGVVVITVIILLCVLLLGGAYKKPLDTMIKAYTTGEGKYMAEITPKYVKEELEEKIEDSNKYDSIEEYYDDYLESYHERLENKYGEGFKIKYKITKEKELTEKQLKEIKNEIKDEYDEKVDVSAGYKLDVEMTWVGPDDDDEDDRTIYVVKMDGDWTFYSGNLLPNKLPSVKKSSSDDD